jgi:hypothetical protein
MVGSGARFMICPYSDLFDNDSYLISVWLGENFEMFVTE